MKKIIGLALCGLAIVMALVRLATIIFALDFIFGTSFILLLVGIFIGSLQYISFKGGKSKSDN